MRACPFLRVCARVVINMHACACLSLLLCCDLGLRKHLRFDKVLAFEKLMSSDLHVTGDSGSVREASSLPLLERATL